MRDWHQSAITGRNVDGACLLPSMSSAHVAFGNKLVSMIAEAARLPTIIGITTALAHHAKTRRAASSVLMMLLPSPVAVISARCATAQPHLHASARH